MLADIADVLADMTDMTDKLDRHDGRFCKDLRNIATLFERGILDLTLVHRALQAARHARIAEFQYVTSNPHIPHQIFLMFTAWPFSSSSFASTPLGNFNTWVRENQYLRHAAARHEQEMSGRLRVGGYQKRSSESSQKKKILVKVTAKTKNASCMSDMSDQKKKKLPALNIKNRANRVRHHLKMAVRSILSFCDLFLATSTCDLWYLCGNVTHDNHVDIVVALIWWLIGFRACSLQGGFGQIEIIHLFEDRQPLGTLQIE